jgi:hypothetical protein
VGAARRGGPAAAAPRDPTRPRGANAVGFPWPPCRTAQRALPPPRPVPIPSRPPRVKHSPLEAPARGGRRGGAAGAAAAASRVAGAQRDAGGGAHAGMRAGGGARRGRGHPSRRLAPPPLAPAPNPPHTHPTGSRSGQSKGENAARPGPHHTAPGRKSPHLVGGGQQPAAMDASPGGSASAPAASSMLQPTPSIKELKVLNWVPWYRSNRASGAGQPVGRVRITFGWGRAPRVPASAPAGRQDAEGRRQSPLGKPRSRPRPRRRRRRRRRSGGRPRAAPPPPPAAAARCRRGRRRPRARPPRPPPSRPRRAAQELLRRSVISFKDLRLVSTDLEESPDGDGGEASASLRRRSNPSNRETPTSSNIDAHNPVGVTVDNGRLAVIMVGLPARGKTFLCNKLMSYLNWWACGAAAGWAAAGCRLGGGPGLSNCRPADGVRRCEQQQTAEGLTAGSGGCGCCAAQTLRPPRPRARAWPQARPPHGALQRRQLPPEAARRGGAAGRVVLRPQQRGGGGPVCQERGLGWGQSSCGGGVSKSSRGRGGATLAHPRPPPRAAPTPTLNPRPAARRASARSGRRWRT